MVAQRWFDPRLLPRRDQRRPTLLALSRRPIPSDRRAPLVSARPVFMSYAELAVTTNYSFLRGASHPGDFVIQAASLGYPAIGIADRNTLAGVVRAYEEWSKLDCAARPRLLIGARLVFNDGTPDILAYPQDRAAYGRLCRLLSLGKSRAPKGECFLCLPDLLDPQYREGLLLIVMPPSRTDAIAPLLTRLGPGTWLAASMLYTGEDRRRLRDLKRLART